MQGLFFFFSFFSPDSSQLQTQGSYFSAWILDTSSYPLLPHPFCPTVSPYCPASKKIFLNTLTRLLALFFFSSSTCSILGMNACSFLISAPLIARYNTRTDARASLLYPQGIAVCVALRFPFSFLDRVDGDTRLFFPFLFFTSVRDSRERRPPP